MDTTVRLAELMDDFRERSERKHTNGGYAEILYHAPRKAWIARSRRRADEDPLEFRMMPQYWQIVYRDKTGRIDQWGIVIGRTRAAAIKWLLIQRRQWP